MLILESRQRYAARSLKQNVEFVEAETRRLFNKVTAIRDILKHQHTEMRYLLPLDFHETFDRLVDFLENLELKGGVEEIMALPRAKSIMSYENDGSLPKALVDAITAKVRPLILQETASLRSQMQTLRDEALTMTQLADIMQPESSDAGANKDGRAASAASKSRSSSMSGPSTTAADPFAKEKELARRRTVNLIKECIAEERQSFDEERNRLEARERAISNAEEANRATVGSVIQEITFSNTEKRAPASRPKTPSMILIQNQPVDAANKVYVDEKMRQLEEQVIELRLSLNANKGTAADDLAFLTAKLESLEAATAQMQEHDAEAREQRRKDSEALKIMQKRLANVSVDNVSVFLAAFAVLLDCWIVFFGIYSQECQLSANFVSRKLICMLASHQYLAMWPLCFLLPVLTTSPSSLSPLLFNTQCR